MASSESGPPNWNNTTPTRVPKTEFVPAKLPLQVLNYRGTNVMYPVRSFPRSEARQLSYTGVRVNGKEFRIGCFTWNIPDAAVWSLSQLFGNYIHGSLTIHLIDSIDLALGSCPRYSRTGNSPSSLEIQPRNRCVSSG